jgi:hypothetical protein
MLTPHNRDVDDVGFFDSLLLARPYRFVVETSGLSPRFNEQALDAAQLTLRTLRACGARFLWTRTKVDGLTELARPSDAHIYQIDRAQPRADFVPSERVRVVAGDELHRVLRDPSFALEPFALIDASWSGALRLGANSGAAATPASVRYERPSSDEISVSIDCAERGLVRVLEAWDPGWSATLDGQVVAVIPAHDTFLAVCVGPGTHALRFTYRTPGAGIGLVLTLASAALLAALARWMR